MGLVSIPVPPDGWLGDGKKWQIQGRKDKCEGGGHVAIPSAVLNGAAYLGLGAHARMLLWDLAAQYRGDNNGDLCMAWKLMQPRGWKSEATLHKAKRELLEAGLIVETRKGARPNKCSLFAFKGGWRAQLRDLLALLREQRKALEDI